MVFVPDKHKKKLMLCSEKRERLRLERGRARVQKIAPFTVTLAWGKCNQAKGNMPAGEFLAGRPDVLAQLLAHAKAPLKNAAAVNRRREDKVKQDTLRNTENPRPGRRLRGVHGKKLPPMSTNQQGGGASSPA
jgi:hypothetical protein